MAIYIALIVLALLALFYALYKFITTSPSDGDTRIVEYDVVEQYDVQYYYDGVWLSAREEIDYFTGTQIPQYCATMQDAIEKRKRLQKYLGSRVTPKIKKVYR